MRPPASPRIGVRIDMVTLYRTPNPEATLQLWVRRVQDIADLYGCGVSIVNYFQVDEYVIEVDTTVEKYVQRHYRSEGNDPRSGTRAPRRSDVPADQVHQLLLAGRCEPGLGHVRAAQTEHLHGLEQSA